MDVGTGDRDRGTGEVLRDRMPRDRLWEEDAIVGGVGVRVARIDTGGW